MRYLFILLVIIIGSTWAREARAAFPVPPVGLVADTTISAEAPHLSSSPEQLSSVSNNGSDGVLSLSLSLAGIGAFLAAVGTMHPLFFALGIVMGALAIVTGISASGKRNAGLAKAGTILGIIDVVITVAAGIALLI